MSIVTAYSELEYQFGEITILFEHNKDGHLVGCAMNGIRKASRKDLFTSIGFLDVVLSAGTLTGMGKKIIQDAKMPLQSALASLPPIILPFPKQPH